MSAQKIEPARGVFQGQHELRPWDMKCKFCDAPWTEISKRYTPGICLGASAGHVFPVYTPTVVRAAVPAVDPPTMRATRVYVSGPLTTGMLTANVHRAACAADVLLDRGFAVYLPHTNVLWEMISPPLGSPETAYERWLSHDFHWVEACDVMLRLAGESSGGDREVEHALSLKRPVYMSLDTLLACEKPRRVATA